MHTRRSSPPSPAPSPQRQAPGNRRSTARRVGAVGTLLAVAALLASACSSGVPTKPTKPGSPAAGAALVALPRSTPAALAPYYGQRLTWRDCGAAGFQCATLRAPLDYAKPDAGSVRLAVARKKA